ncbi:MAG: hypothetical protein MMC23_009577 [Stictis urceolatum]|nr:hypothetical protein [Stictis urceolata]
MFSVCFLVTALAGVALGISFDPLDEDCQFRPKGHAPGTWPDTPISFVANPVYKNISTTARVPDDYYSTFSNQHAAVSETSSTKHLDTHLMYSYDTDQCAEYCNNKPRCLGFNTYIQRDALQKPAADCPNPNSTVNYYCTLWTTPSTEKQATNFGQTQVDFVVVIAGSNGYAKEAAVETTSSVNSISSTTIYVNGTKTTGAYTNGIADIMTLTDLFPRSEPPQPPTTVTVVRDRPLVTLAGLITVVPDLAAAATTNTAYRATYSLAMMLVGLAVAMASTCMA